MTHYPKQPRVGDVIEVWVGLVTVERVYERGLRLDVTDRTGRRHHIGRAEGGCWYRP